MTGNKLIRVVTACVVVAVAIFAAIVSYSHIYDLGHTHGQDGTAARLLPLSVDGLILAASLIILYEARNNRDTPALARVMLWLGVIATVGANATFGAPFGPVGIAVSLWPAIAFIGSVEMIMRQIRKAQNDTAPKPEPDTALPVTAPVMQVTTPVIHSEVPALQTGLDGNASKADRVRHAVRALSNGSPAKPADVAAWLTERGTKCEPQYVRDVTRRDRLAARSESPEG